MATELRTSNQSRTSTKIVVGFLILLALAYGGKLAYQQYAIGSKKFAPLAPGRVNLIGVDTKVGGYRIVVANGIAHLVESQQETFGGDRQDENSSDDAGQKKKVPLKEMLEAMRQDPEAVGRFVSVLNDMRDEDLPAVRVLWPQADIEKALAGDAAMVTKLERDLNVKRDGTPLPEFRPSTFQRGIVLQLPVQLNVPGENGTMTVKGTLLYPYQTRLMKALEQRVKDVSNLTPTQLTGYYAEIAKGYLSGATRKENVAETLKQITSKQNLDALCQLPQTVMSSIKIVINDSLISKASYSPEDSGQGKTFNMDVELTPEGRDRLWQYSRDKVGTQLLLVVNGIAIAAPRIGHELAETHLTISNLPDERLVKEAVDGINVAKEAK